MEHQARSSSAVSAPQAHPHETHHEGRGTWVLTAYGISGLALFGILLYFFSTYVTHWVSPLSVARAPSPAFRP